MCRWVLPACMHGIVCSILLHEISSHSGWCTGDGNWHHTVRCMVEDTHHHTYK
jgi:hypothetical protein